MESIRVSCVSCCGWFCRVVWAAIEWQGCISRPLSSNSPPHTAATIAGARNAHLAPQQHNGTPPQVMGESSVSPYGVAAGACIANPPPHIAVRRHRAATTTPADGKNGAPTQASSATATATATAAATAPPQEPLPLGGRVYRLTKFAEKPTAEFARENLVTPGLGRGDGGEGRHLVVFGQASFRSGPVAI